MAKVLYVTDLDGTLLDREGWLTDFTIQIFRRMSDEGMLVSIATARSLNSCNDLIWLLGLRVPVILLNGSTIYDTVAQRHLFIQPLPEQALPKVFWTLDEHGLCGFLHTVRDGQAQIYYRQFHRHWDSLFHAQRAESYPGRLHKVPDVARADLFGGVPSYIVVGGEQTLLQRIQLELEHLPGIASDIYCDIYNDYFYMDIFPASSSKGKAMLTLREMTGADEIVAFGDNYNDMQMLLAADRSYVPKNGIIAARNVASEVLDYSHRDSVAHYLAREFGWE